MLKVVCVSTPSAWDGLIRVESVAQVQFLIRTRLFREKREERRDDGKKKRKISSNSRQSNSTGSKRERKSLPGCNDNVPRWVFILSSCLWEAASGFFFFHSSLIVMFHYQGKVSQMLFHHKDEGEGVGGGGTK